MVASYKQSQFCIIKNASLEIAKVVSNIKFTWILRKRQLFIPRKQKEYETSRCCLVNSQISTWTLYNFSVSVDIIISLNVLN